MRMPEGDLLRMQGLPHGWYLHGARPAAAVHGVADDRMPNGGQVYPNLVRAPGLGKQPQEGDVRVALDDLEGRQRVAAATPHRHSLARDRVTGDGGGDSAGRVSQSAPDKRQVLLLDFTAPELVAKVGE